MTRPYIIFDAATGRVLSWAFACADATEAVAGLPAGRSATAHDAAPASFPEPPFDGAELRWDGAATYWHDPRTISQVKATKRQALAAIYTTKRGEGVTVGGKVAPTDPDSWTRYLAIKAMADEATGWIDVPIPLVDGTFELLTKPKAGALWDALKTLERSLLATLRDKVYLVNAASTIAEVEAVTWP